jgi:hypothetical protein
VQRFVWGKKEGGGGGRGVEGRGWCSHTTTKLHCAVDQVLSWRLLVYCLDALSVQDTKGVQLLVLWTDAGGTGSRPHRSTSPPKSAWPGVSTAFMVYPL